VTLSGGEPMMQADFAIAFARALKGRGIHVAVETSGYASPGDFLGIAPFVDLFLFDCKATGEERHRALTGAGCGLILKNLAALDALKKPIILRCPLIPGLNDSDEHLEAIAGLAKRHPSIEGLELLPYHRMGEAKRLQLGQAESLPGVAAPSEAQKRRWMDALSALGCQPRLV